MAFQTKHSVLNSDYNKQIFQNIYLFRTFGKSTAINQMKILYDHQIFSSQPFGGISRYLCSLMQEFQKPDSGIEFTVPLFFSNNNYIHEPGLYPDLNYFFRNHNFRGRDRIIEFINRRKVISYMGKNKQQVQVFHPTYYSPYFLDYLGKIPYVLTVHDMIHERFEHLPARDKECRDKAAAAGRAAAIIVPSESTRQDLIGFLGTPPEKIHVIHHGFTQIQQNLNCPELPEKYFLYVGQRKYYKNFPLLLKAFAETVAADSKVMLLCCGGGAFTPEENAWINQLELSERVMQRSFTDGELFHVYHHAAAFVYPSQCEGFGIPVLEAFGCTCPAILSDIPCFREVAGDAANYFNPDSAAELSNLMLAMLNSENLRNELRLKGRKRLESFSWQKAAGATAEVYRKISS